MKKDASLLDIFLVFAKIGAFTIGGGYVIIPVIQEEMSKRGWIKEEELPDIVAIAQSAPGLITANVSIFAGYKLRGIPGSVVATLGSILPSFIIILLIAMLFANFQDNPYVISAFSAIRPVVIALIAAPTIRMYKKNCKNTAGKIIAAATLVGVAFLRFSPVYILMVLMGLSFVYSYHKEKQK